MPASLICIFRCKSVAPLLREADGLGFQESCWPAPWETWCMMEQGIWPGLAWQELQESVRKGATEKTHLLTPRSLSVSQTIVLLVDYSHTTWIIWLVLSAGMIPEWWVDTKELVACSLALPEEAALSHLWFLTWQAWAQSSGRCLTLQPKLTGLSWKFWTLQFLHTRPGIQKFYM